MYKRNYINNNKNKINKKKLIIETLSKEKTINSIGSTGSSVAQTQKSNVTNLITNYINYNINLSFEKSKRNYSHENTKDYMTQKGRIPKNSNTINSNFNASNNNKTANENYVKAINNKLIEEKKDSKKDSNKSKYLSSQHINNKIIEDKQAIIKKCIPSFVSYLDKKIKERNQNTLNEFKKAYASKKFCELLKSFSNKKIISPKSDVVNEMKREAKYSETRPLYQIKIFKLLRKKYIREIVTKLEEPSRLYKLFYLVNVTQMHKKITNQRFFRELIRKWRFIAFTKKMARRKLELMYKNLHASYMQMADEIFGDDEVNPSVIKQFEMFGNNVGMFTAQEPEVGEEMSKKYYTTVDKRYVFKNDREISNEMRKSYTRQKQIIVEKEEMKESEEFSSSEKRPRNKDLSSSFKKIKSGGIQKNLFKKDN